MNDAVSTLASLSARTLLRLLPGAVRNVSCVAVTLVALLASTGCTTTPEAAVPAAASEPPPQVLQPGDVVHIAFPGAAALETNQQIRRDGKLNLNILGEVQAAGKTPAQLEQELIAGYATQLVSKEVKVTVVSSSFSVFVTGAVMNPGKILPNRTLTAFEAIMEAGGFDYQTANTRAVRVIRSEDGQTQTYTLDLKAVLDGKSSRPFYLKANDTVYVPQKFQLF